ncbi:MAG: preprotein translocase subunit SecG [Bdellovibrionaceae bacterium]|nr:preprotein translocase subunit SecG [Pseudobdellovibrionaceae bacterium]
MMTFVAIVHILVALILIGLVLIQDSKGDGAFGMGGGGGGSNSLLGATGAQTLAAKLTRIAAVIFAITCISLTMMTADRSRSVIDTGVIPASSPAKDLPGTGVTGEAPANDSGNLPTTPAQEAPAAPTK